MTEKEYNQQENICILYIWQRIEILSMKNYYKTLTHIHRKMSRKTSPVDIEDKPNGTWEHKQLRLTRNQESANDKSTEMILQPSGIAKSGKYQNPSPGEATDTVWNNIQLWQWVSLQEYLTIPDNTGEPWKYDAKQSKYITRYIQHGATYTKILYHAFKHHHTVYGYVYVYG